jgi:hypothetical protein
VTTSECRVLYVFAASSFLEGHVGFVPLAPLHYVEGEGDGKLPPFTNRAIEGGSRNGRLVVNVVDYHLHPERLNPVRPAL